MTARISAMMATATGRRTPSGVMTRQMSLSVQAWHVHAVVADAEARHHGEPAVGRHAGALEALGQQDQRVVACKLRRVHRPV